MPATGTPKKLSDAQQRAHLTREGLKLGIAQRPGESLDEFGHRLTITYLAQRRQKKPREAWDMMEAALDPWMEKFNVAPPGSLAAIMERQSIILERIAQALVPGAVPQEIEPPTGLPKNPVAEASQETQDPELAQSLAIQAEQQRQDKFDIAWDTQKHHDLNGFLLGAVFHNRESGNKWSFEVVRNPDMTIRHVLLTPGSPKPKRPQLDWGDNGQRH